MKNTFKILGLAMLATALMFTACKKDDDEENENNEQTVNVATGTNAAGTITVTFKGAATNGNYNLGYASGVYETDADTIYFGGHAFASVTNDDKAVFPGLDTYIEFVNSETDGGWSVTGLNYYENDEHVVALTQKAGRQFADWKVEDFKSFTVDNFVPTTVALTCTINADMYSAYEYFIEEKQADGEYTVNNLDVKLNGFTFTQATSK